MPTRNLKLAALSLAALVTAGLVLRPWGSGRDPEGDRRSGAPSHATHSLPPPTRLGPQGPKRRAWKTTVHRDRAAWIRRALEDDQGQVPEQALWRGKAAYDRLRGGSGATALAGLSVSRWTNIGPVGIGGRVRAMAWRPRSVPPGAPPELWIGGVAGGLWRSYDRGSSWVPVGDFLPSLAVSSLVVDPNDASRIWAGTGEAFSLIGVAGAGVLMSTNSGATWSVLPSTETWQYVNRLAISPDGQVLLAAVEGGGMGDGIYRSTDGGTSWTRTLVGAFGDVDFHSTASSRAVVGVRGGGLGATAAVFSTDDGGLNWDSAAGLPLSRSGLNGAGTPVISVVQRVETCWAPGTGRVFASVASFVPATGTFQTGGLFLSTDNGATFAARNVPATEPGGPVGDGTEFLSRVGDYANALWVGLPPDVRSEAPLLVGAVDLYRSFDEGSTLAQATDWRFAAPNAGDSMHADHHIILPAPEYDGSLLGDNSVFFGNDGGIYMTENVRTAGVTTTHEDGWKERNAGLGITQFYAIDVGAIDGRVRLVGGTQDNGSLYFRDSDGVLDAAADWLRAFGGDGGGCALDPGDEERFYGTVQFADDLWASNVATMQNPSGWLGNVRDLDGVDRGNAALNRSAPFLIPDVVPAAPSLAPFIVTGLALDSQSTQRMLMGLNSLWRTNDVRTPPTATVGPSWVAIKPPAPPFGLNPDLIKVVKIDPSDSNRVWIGHVSGRLYVSTDATAAAPAWTQIGPIVSLVSLATGASLGTASWPTRALLGVAVNPRNGNHVAVTFGGYADANVWQTFDGGLTWARSDTLPALPAWDVEIHPDRGDSLYVATELGVVASWDRGRTWTAPAPGHDGPAATRVTDLAWQGKRLYAATFGRGVFRQRVDPAGPPLLALRGNRKVLVPGSGTADLALAVEHVSPPPDGEAGLEKLRSMVWSNQRGTGGEASSPSATEFSLLAKDHGTTPLGRVYLVLLEAKDAAGTPGWSAASVLVPRDASPATLLGLLAKATRDEMALARDAPQVAALAGNKSGMSDGAPSDYGFLAHGGSGP